ncbi:Short-chain dehydrogenase reductase 2a [Hondaea fermentalgiana]|uniref:Short-chain dehydrogenase reductase 2a n=1 Tax=Hondaea fermentalgiana TaxID=2315210 RepID=A0A2R5G9Y9_9STRA|nr:Short-chain dehydrogenase reductase 2a [Hondaea fermentalgiana]|eukprot:GBG25363.1 Short-chain dehydrogenase reductase 2a [Hondaea fermentalgiana]
MPGRMEGKACVVTGAASGIGRATVLEFVKEGAKVVAADVQEEGLKETVQMASEISNGAVVGQFCDVSNDESVKELIERCCTEFGGIDVCYANAGIVFSGRFWDETVETFDRIMRVNVTGVFLCFKYAFLKMDQQGRGGSLLATASVAGIRSGAGDLSYSASKAAVINLCRVVANQCTGTNIRCNCIAPGLIETGMTRPVFDLVDQKGIRDKVGQINPTLRYGEPVEIAKAALFLASDEASYVNGQVLPVCGGLSSSHPVARRGKGMSS